MLTYGNRLAEISSVASPALSTGAQATASSQAAAEFGPLMLTDGNPGTWWSMAEADATPWAEIDLGQPTRIGGAKIVEAAGRIRGYRLEYRADAGQPWITVQEGTAIGPKLMLEFAPVTGQFFRLSIPATQGRCVIREFQLIVAGK
jgi:hypothetical protein